MIYYDILHTFKFEGVLVRSDLLSHRTSVFCRFDHCFSPILMLIVNENHLESKIVGPT